MFVFDDSVLKLTQMCSLVFSCPCLVCVIEKLRMHILLELIRDVWKIESLLSFWLV